MTIKELKVILKSINENGKVLIMTHEVYRSGEYVDCITDERELFISDLEIRKDSILIKTECIHE